MVINVPSELMPQVEALIKKQEEKKERIAEMKNVPYWEIVLTGKPDSSGHENFSKIKFPALVAYSSCGARRQGILTHGDSGYFLWDCTRQWNYNSQGGAYDTLEDLWEAWKFSVLKAKVIGKQG